MAGQHRLHLGRVDVVAPGDDQLGTPPTDRHVAVVGHRGQVPRGEPVSGGEGGASPVALAQRRAAHEAARRYPARPHRRVRPPRRAAAAPPSPGDARPRAGWRASTRSPSCRSAPARRHRRRRTGATDRPPAGPIRRRTGAGTPSTAARPVAASRWYMVGTPKNMVLAEAACRTAFSSKRSNTDSGGARSEGAEQSGTEAVDMEERQREDETIVGGPLPCGQQRGDPGQQRAVCVHRPLGLAGGPRRVDDQRVVARSAVRKDRRPGVHRRLGEVVDAHDRETADGAPPAGAGRRAPGPDGHRR